VSEPAPKIPYGLVDALRPFLHAAAVGYCVEKDVEEANPRQHTKHPLIAFAGYAGHYAAQSRVSWADWKRLLDVADDAGFLNDDTQNLTGKEL
jgi:hypothetical protein